MGKIGIHLFSTIFDELCYNTMNWLINIVVLLGFFALMEATAWFTHKYIMHGFLWVWHKSHHEPRKGKLELNDIFGLMFAIPSVWLIVVGSFEFDWRFFAGLGIALYGLAYFLVHDVLIHRRFKWFEKWNNPYLKAIRRAHQAHHSKRDRFDGECFGMLLAPMKYFKEANAPRHS